MKHTGVTVGNRNGSAETHQPVKVYHAVFKCAILCMSFELTFGNVASY